MTRERRSVEVEIVRGTLHYGEPDGIRKTYRPGERVKVTPTEAKRLSEGGTVRIPEDR